MKLRLALCFVITCSALIWAAPSAPVSAAPGLSKPFLLSSDTMSQMPALAVDDSGTGYFAWDTASEPASNDNPLEYCRIPRGHTTCDVRKTFNFAGLGYSYAIGNPSVLLPAPGEVVILTFRCCQYGTYAFVSHDGGRSFESPRLIGTLHPSQTILGPGDNAVSTVDTTDTQGVHYQAVSLDGTTNETADLGSDPPRTYSYDGAVGLVDVNTPIVAFDDLHNAFFRTWKGSGNLNAVPSWSPLHSLGKITDLQFASGYRGTVLVGLVTLTNPSRYEYVVRRWNPVTGSFGPGTVLSDPSAESFVNNRSVYEDSGGNISVVFSSNRADATGQPMQYRASIDGGVTWLKERTLFVTDEDIGHVSLATGQDGGGWVVWRDEYGIRAAAVPTIASEPGGRPDPNCPETLTVHSVHALALSGCFKRSGGVYQTDGAAKINGLDVTPASGSSVTIDASTGAVKSSGAQVRAGNVLLSTGGFDWSGGGSGLQATFNNLGSFDDSLFGFGVTGSATLTFDNGDALIPVHLELPGIFGGVTGDMTLRLKNPGGLQLDQLHIHVDDAFLGALEVKSLDVQYHGGVPPTLEGSATFLLPPTYSQPGVDVGFGFSNGQFSHAEGSFPLTLPLFPPFLYLQKIGLALATNPLTIKGGVDLSGGPQILGASAITMGAQPTDAGGFTFQLSNPAILRLSGNLAVVGIPFASGYVEYHTDGLLKFGGGMDFTLPLDIANLQAEVPQDPPLGPGFVDLSSGRFNAPLQGHVCVPAGCNVIDIGAQGVISTSGIAACGQYILYQGPPGRTLGVSVGFGYHWGQGPQVFGDLGGCDVSPYASALSGRRDALSPIHDAVKVASGLPQENIVIQGAKGAPQIKVTAPNNETVSSVKASVAKSAHMMVFSDPAAKRTYVMIGMPPAGTYTIQTLSGSPQITAIRHADGLAQPNVSGSVTGSGSSRTLTYHVKPIPGQEVVFAEQAKGAAADIGVATSTSGKLRFSPTAGPAGKREIVAQVQQNGIPRKNIVVATYTALAASAPAPPKYVHVKRKPHQNVVVVSWAKVPSVSLYTVHVHLTDGRDKIFSLKPKSLTLTLKQVAKTTHGYAAVSVLSTSGLRGSTKRVKIPQG